MWRRKVGQLGSPYKAKHPADVRSTAVPLSDLDQVLGLSALHGQLELREGMNYGGEGRESAAVCPRGDKHMCIWLLRSGPLIRTHGEEGGGCVGKVICVFYKNAEESDHHKKTRLLCEETRSNRVHLLQSSGTFTNLVSTIFTLYQRNKYLSI